MAALDGLNCYSNKRVCVCVCEGVRGSACAGQSSMQASSITEPWLAYQHHGQRPGSSVAVLMEEQVWGPDTTGDLLQLLHSSGNTQVV